MADLDDFFAKRDKKKSKKKFDTSEDLAKVLEQKAKEKKKLETGKSNYQSEGGRQSPGPGLPAEDDDEWIEAEEKKPDYSDLKIKELILSDDDEEDGVQEGKEGEDGTNEGPWNKKKKPKGEEETPKEEASEETKETDSSKPEAEVDVPAAEANSPDAEDESKGEVEEESSKTEKEEAPKKYVPPSMRNKQPESAASAPAGPPPQGSAAYVPPSRRGLSAGAGIGPSASQSTKKKGAVPTLEDEESFPSLS